MKKKYRIWYGMTLQIKAHVVKVSTTDDQTTWPKLTKRIILSYITEIYDPIGIASTFLIRAKIGMQRLWRMGCDWDEQLPPDTCERWFSLFQELMKLNPNASPRVTNPMNLGRCLKRCLQNLCLCEVAN